MGKKIGKGKGKATVLAPKGGGPLKRTPSFTFDPAAKDTAEGEQLYNIREIVAERVAISKCPCDSCARNKGKQVSQWRVNWEGFASENDTWEPLSHLAGSEATIADFTREKIAQNAAHMKKQKEKRAKKLKEDEEKKRAATLAMVSNLLWCAILSLLPATPFSESRFCPFPLS